MAIMSKFHTIVGNKSANDPAMADTSVDDPNTSHVLADREAGKDSANEVVDADDAKPSENAQNGVRKIEAVTLAWGKGSVYLILVLYALLSHCDPLNDC